MELTLLNHLLVALALGALIGLEREYARYKQRGHTYAGIRTFPLIALFGALSGYFGDVISVWILLLGLVVIGIVTILAYYAVSDKKHIGATTEVAGMLTFFIGLLAYRGELGLATILTVVITVILYTRSVLHHFAAKIHQKEMSATITFAVIAFVVLPFLPNDSYGPYGIFNPFLIWLVVLLVSGISFAGYLLLKWFGERGILLSGLFGGLVSSTVTTAHFAQRSHKEEHRYRALALGVLAANAVMFFRMLIEVFVINPSLGVTLVLPFTVLMAINALLAYVLWTRTKQTSGKLMLGSPFTLWPALKFALFFTIILGVVKGAEALFSLQGIYIVSLASGLANVDAITISLSQLAQNGSEQVARNGILLAALAGMLTKGGIVWLLGEKKFSWLVIQLLLVIMVLGMVVLYFM
ncbi:MgtC/SapB family protein [Candidatus Woesearchaeota archaeon]|nr:MgtC/SapB family protein [Candidatus Woesearchaeota archaeon]